MENIIITTQRSTNSSSYHTRLLKCICSACDVKISDVASASKRRDVANAKSIFCAIMIDNGYSKSETARHLNADHKSVYHYIGNHQDKMNDQSYKSLYDKSLVLFENYAKDITDYDHAINDLRQMVMDLQRKYEHIKELLLN
jgi:DNA-binding CsgD family transcriptional regulator